MSVAKKKRSPMFNKKLVCEVCKKEVERRSVAQKYCPECSQKRDRERKLRWAKKHPLPDEKVRAKRQKSSDRARNVGLEINRSERENTAWFGELPVFNWGIGVAIPFDYSLSKNHIWSLRSKGHVYLRQEARKAREYIAWMIKDALNKSKRKLVQAKLWIDIFIQKPDHRGDAVNFLDLICDAIKDATGLDDKWYCIRRLDWQIVKEKPLIYIGISQIENEDCKVCSYCGRILPATLFLKNRRECSDCRRSIKKHERQAEKETAAGTT